MNPQLLPRPTSPEKILPIKNEFRRPFEESRGRETNDDDIYAVVGESECIILLIVLSRMKQIAHDIKNRQWL